MLTRVGTVSKPTYGPMNMLMSAYRLYLLQPPWVTYFMPRSAVRVTSCLYLKINNRFFLSDGLTLSSDFHLEDLRNKGDDDVSNSYITSTRDVSDLNCDARGRVAPEGGAI